MLNVVVCEWRGKRRCVYKPWFSDQGNPFQQKSSESDDKIAIPYALAVQRRSLTIE